VLFLVLSSTLLFCLSGAQNNNFPDKVIKQLKSQIQKKHTNTEQRNKQKHKSNQKMGSLHLSQPKDKKTDQPLQTHGHKYCIQKHKCHTTAYETKTTKPHARTQQAGSMNSPATHVN
jgi:hypothetical protein